MAAKKVKIKRVSKPKKPPGTRQKILAGLGVGSALLSVGGGQVAKQPQNSRIVSKVKTSDKKGKIKQVLTNIFGVPEAKAYGGMNTVNSSGKTIEELMINSGYNPNLVNSNFMGGQGPSSGDVYNSSGLALGGGGQAASGGGSSQIGSVSGDMAQGEANAASAFAEGLDSGSGETPTEGNALPSSGQAEGADSGSGEGAQAGSGMISAEGPFLEDTEPISIPVVPSDNYQQMYATPAPAAEPDVNNLPVNNNYYSENLTPSASEQAIVETQSPGSTVSGNYAPYTTATPAPVFSNTSDANTTTDAEANTTGGQYGTYPSAASFFVDPSAQDASNPTNPAIVDGTAGMFGPGSGLDAGGNQIPGPQSDNNWDSVWQNATGQNPNTAISPSMAYGGGSSWEQAVLQSGGNIGDSYIVINNQPYTRQQWESGLAPGEQGPVSPSATPESPFVNITSDAVPIEYSPATYDYLGNRTDSQQTSAPSNAFAQSAEDGSYDVKNTEPPVMPEISSSYADSNQTNVGNKYAGSSSSRSINLGTAASAAQAQSASAEEFFTEPNVLTETELNQQFQGEGAEYKQPNNSTTEQAVSATVQDNLKSELSKYQSQKVDTISSNINAVLNTPEVPDAESSGDFGNAAASTAQDTSAIENSDSKAPTVSKTFTPTWLKDATPSAPAVLEEPSVQTADTQTQLADMGGTAITSEDASAKKGIITSATEGVSKAGKTVAGWFGIKSAPAATATPTATETNTALPDKTIKVGKQSVDVYNLGTDQNPIWMDFEGNLYKASGKSMLVVGSTKYEALKDSQGQPMNLNTMSVLEISKVWSQGNSGSLDLADKSLLQNVANVTAATAKAAGNQVKNNKTVAAVGGVYTLGGVGAYGAGKEVVNQLKTKTANDYLSTIYQWAWPQDWETGGAKVVNSNGQEPVLKIAGQEIPRSQVQNMTTAQLMDLVNQKINGPNKP